MTTPTQLRATSWRSRRPDSADRSPASKNLILAIILIGQLMVVLDATIVNVALPDIQRSLSLSTANLSWVINAYTLAFGGLLLLGARAGDILGRRRVFVVGIAVFTFASLLAGLAQSSTWLLSGRALQGPGAAIAPAAPPALLAAP